MKKTLKKISVLLFLIGTFLIFGKQTNAKTTNLQDIVDKFPNTYIKDYYDNVTLSIDSENNILKVHWGDMTMDYIKIGEDYIEYDIRGIEMPTENHDYEKFFVNNFVMVSILEAALELNGANFEDTTGHTIVDYINTIYEQNITYEKYGFMNEAGEYQVYYQDGFPGIVGDFQEDDLISVKVTNHIKISLDSEKLTKLVNIFDETEETTEENDNKEQDTDKKEENTDNKEETAKEDPKNPKTSTGFLLPLFTLFALGGVGSFILLFTKKSKY